MKARWVIGLLGFLVLLLGLTGNLPAQTTTIYACVNTRSGTIRIVSASTICQDNSAKISWNTAGQPGPPGPQGPPGPTPLITSYRDRAAFTAAAGLTTTIDFSTLPPGDNFFASLTMEGVTFHNVRGYWQAFVYQFPTWEMRVDLPPGTRAVGTDLGSFYGDPGIHTIAFPTGQESTAMSGVPYVAAFLGVLSDTPIPWVTFRFYSSCTPPGIMGVPPTCPGFPSIGFEAGIALYDNFTFGPGN